MYRKKTVIKIHNSVMKDILEQSINGYPEEICGICAGSEKEPKTISTLYPCENIQNKLHAENPEKYPRTAKDGYFIDPEKWLELSLLTDSEDKVINMIYHSHIDCGAYFSREDERMAAPLGEPSYPDLVYLVVSVVKRKISEISAYIWDEKEKKYKETAHSIINI